MENISLYVINKDISDELNSTRNKKHLKKLNDLVKSYNHDYPYYSLYKEKFLLPKLITQYYINSIFTEEKVRKGFIVTHGRDFTDGFSGIFIKNKNYTNRFVIEIKDGERGQLFCKTYDGLPTIERLIIDSFYYSLGKTNE